MPEHTSPSIQIRLFPSFVIPEGVLMLMGKNLNFLALQPDFYI